MACKSTFRLSITQPPFRQRARLGRRLPFVDIPAARRLVSTLIAFALFGWIPAGMTAACASQQENVEVDGATQPAASGEAAPREPSDGQPTSPPVVRETDIEIYSGPQPGEELPDFPIRIVFGSESGEEIDLIGRAEQSPIVLIIVHEVTRPTIAVTRVIAKYAAGRAGDGLQAGVIFLTGDATETEAFLRRAQHAMPPDIRIGISLDGLEGPGEYGLNRNVAMTILIGKEGKTTGNFALIQPSLQTDVLPVVQSIIEVLGSGSLPSLERLIGEDYRMERPARAAVEGEVSENQIRSLLQPLIRRNASPEEVKRVAEAVQQVLESDEAMRSRIGQIAANIVSADKLQNYGSPAAQEVLLRWSRLYGPREKEGDSPEIP